MLGKKGGFTRNQVLRSVSFDPELFAVLQAANNTKLERQMRWATFEEYKASNFTFVTRTAISNRVGYPLNPRSNAAIDAAISGLEKQGLMPTKKK